jgi:hypothetical protein
MDNNTGSKKSPITFVIAVMATVCASLVAAQDIVPVSDIGGGTSVFVFRGASRSVAKKFVAPARTRRTKLERIESAKKVTKPIRDSFQDGTSANKDRCRRPE